MKEAVTALYNIANTASKVVTAYIAFLELLWYKCLVSYRRPYISLIGFKRWQFEWLGSKILIRDE